MLQCVVRLGFQTSIHLRIVKQIVKHIVKISMFSPEYVLIWIEYDPSD
jgi:hypothetical protein